MSLSKALDVCTVCCFRDACDHKQLASAAAVDVHMHASAEMIKPVDNITINVDGNTPIAIPRESIERELKKSLYYQGLMYGA